MEPGKQWKCASLKVPLDYANPQGETIGLALIRATAKNHSRRLGSLVFNFGGPGGSGVAMLPPNADSYEALHSGYDLVSFDPRGVGESAGIKCEDPDQADTGGSVDGTTEYDSAIQAMKARNAKYIAACQRNSGKVLPHVDTVSAARDMDLLREVLGEKKLNYFGISYGSQLGGVYAHLFPKNVGHAVLDGVPDPTADELGGLIANAKGFQLALNHYMDDCFKTRGAGCPTGKGGTEGNEKINALLNSLEGHPLPTDDNGRKLTQDLAAAGLLQALYDKASWGDLSDGLEEAMKNGRGDTLLSFGDMFTGRTDRGDGPFYSNQKQAQRAIKCADTKKRYTYEDVQALLPMFRNASPVFGEMLAGSLTNCTGWPVTGQSDTSDVQADGAPPILVIGTTGDPATPYEGAQKMSQALGTGVGALITFKGEGHGSYDSGNPCIKNAVDTYFLDNKLPTPGLTCS